MVSTKQFDYLTERVRSGFSDSEKVFMGQIYSPMDDGGMMFISAESQEIEGLKVFLKAVQKPRGRIQEKWSIKILAICMTM
ncbi:hypothetical protein ACO0LM_15880 [Undibacterium sp. Di26W]|uniref:hypothetical protein n=1 Tax=Undibacterium sp. Di26W TaxID=3413035 RepID=UPI003BF3C0C6